MVTFRGLLLQNQHRYEDAIKCYNDAIQFRPRLAGTVNITIKCMPRNLGNDYPWRSAFEYKLQLKGLQLVLKCSPPWIIVTPNYVA